MATKAQVPSLPRQITHTQQNKNKHIESLLGPLLSHSGDSIFNVFDDFQLTLFDLISNASDDGIQQYFQQKSTDIHRFILTLFIASLHKTNPLRLVNDNAQNLLSTPHTSKSLKEDNPLNSILVSPATTLPPPPKRKSSIKQQPVQLNEVPIDHDIAIDTVDPNKNLNAGIKAGGLLERNLSDIDELKEKDKKQLRSDAIPANTNKNDNIFSVTPLHSDDLLISNRNKNVFDDILADGDAEQDFHDFSKTYESYDGDEFFAKRTTIEREHTTTERFGCNPKEKAIVDEWRHLLEDVRLITPTPVMQDTTPVPLQEADEEEEEEPDTVLVASAEDIKQEQDEIDIILVKSAEMIAPMTRIKGQLKLTSTSITFIPDKEQPQTNKHEVNLAMNPPPLPIAPAVNSSRARSSSVGLLRAPTLATNNINSATPSLTPNTAASSSVDDNDNNKANANESVSRLHSMVLDNADGEQYWVTTSMCSSYQQATGTRYRLMSAHRFWFLDELREIYYRRYQLRNCAFELFFSDDTSWLFNLYSQEERNAMFGAIMGLSPSNLIESKEFFQKPKKAIKSSQIHYKWCRREITNFEYIMRLNTIAGRTFNDLTQYPVVPWVITDFTSDSIDISDESIYRDLSKPIGAINEERLNKFIVRYESLCEDGDDADCFMYGTHYSSIGIILYYLLRQQPFTTYNLSFQGGKFDAPDRLFHSISDCWRGCLENTSDVKELIPEFYYLSSFLVNKQNLDFGCRQDSGEAVGDVVLPPWALSSAQRFIKIMREALESEYVSSHLHEWIDLIFGCKQRGQEAVECHNVFHPYTYEGNVDIDAIEDETQRRAILAQIDEFGQTPLQLFKKAHPKRLKRSEVLTTIFKAKAVKYYSKQQLTADTQIVHIQWPNDKNVIVIGSDYCLDMHRWEANKLSIEKKKEANKFSKIMKIATSKNKQKQNRIGNSAICSKIASKDALNSCFATTADGQYTFACGFEDCSFVVWDVANSKLTQGITKHHDIVSCLALDEDLDKQRAILVTGSYDKSVMVWRVNLLAKNNKKPQKHSRKHSLSNALSSSKDKVKLHEFIDPNPTHILDAQLAAVLCVDVSLKSGIIVCCCADGIVNVYNLSTGEHYHMLQPFIDKVMKKEQSSNNEEEDQEECLSPRVEQEEDQKEQIHTGELSIVRVSSVFGHVLCYSKQTKDIFLYSSAGELLSCSTSRDDTYQDIVLSKTGNHIVCGGQETIIRIKELPSFKTRKRFEDPKKTITKIYLDKDETYMFVGCEDGTCLVYSLPQKAFVKSRVHTLTELGF
eukprot:226255_1